MKTTTWEKMLFVSLMLFFAFVKHTIKVLSVILFVICALCGAKR